jgi:hypothetical protein
VFTGCTTWLDVGTLTWKFDEVVNRVEFTDIVANASTGEVTNVAGFAQLADDVRSVITYLHENEVVVDPETGEGFFIDPVFMETCDEQADMVERLNADADLARLMVTITDAPEDGTSDTSATFEFEAVISSIWIQPGPFVCQLDDRVAEECASPKEYADLTVGEHTFTVYATDRGVGGLATVYNWTVVPPDLTVTITEKPEAQTYDTSASFAFEAVDEEGVVFFCQLDDQVAAEECASPKEFADLEVGDHTFTAYATDGDTDGPPTSYTWTVLSSDLTVRITSAPPAQTTVTSATFVFEAVEADMDFVCELDGLVMDPCTSGEMYPASVGDHTFTVYATDGDTDGLPVTYTWSVLAAGGSGGGGTLPPTPPPPPTPPTPPIIVPPGDQSMDVVSLAPVRLADTRPTPVAAGQVLEVAVAGRGGVPVGAEAVVANVTLVNAAGAGFATVFPCGTVPGASSVNYVAGGTVANEVIAKLSPTGSLCVYTSAAADVLVDVVGYV